MVVVAWAGFGVAAAPSGHLADVPALSQMAVELIHYTGYEKPIDRIRLVACVTASIGRPA